MKNFILPLALVAIGIFAITRKTASIDYKSEVKKWLLNNNPTSNDLESLSKFDLMNQEELKTIYEVVVINKYGQTLPPEIMAKFDAISLKYNIFT